MSKLFYKLGKKVGPKIRKGKWIWHCLTGSEADALESEYAVGKDLYAEVKKQVTIDPDPQVKQLIDKIIPRLTGKLKNKKRKFHVEVTKEGQPNAFALPGGFIFVTRSLVELCRWNVSQIAFVLAHEMSHVIKGHAIERIISTSAIDILSRTGTRTAALSQWLRKAGIRLIKSAYSQDNEFDADILAARLTKAAGFDRNGPVQLFENLSKINNSEAKTLLGEYFSSHPQFADRIKNVNRTLSK